MIIFLSHWKGEKREKGDRGKRREWNIFIFMRENYMREGNKKI